MNKVGRAAPTRVGTTSVRGVGAGPERHTKCAGAVEGGDAREGGKGDGAGTRVGGEGAMRAVAAADEAVAGGGREIRQQGGTGGNGVDGRGGAEGGRGGCRDG